MEQQKLRDAARVSLNKSHNARNAVHEKARELKNSLNDPQISQKNKNGSLTAQLEKLETLLKDLRLACIEVIFYDFEYAQDKDVEGSLWQTHVDVNTEYRRAIGHVNSQNTQSQVVLKRKVDKLYRDFLKTSQFFYRTYIQRLAVQFDIPELRQVAQDLEVEESDVAQQHRPPPPLASLRSKLVKSCYLTLVRMGDLARYRCQHLEKPSKTNLDIALTYYGLARMLNPDDGASYHQTAVLYQPSANHFEIIYHFLRSVCVAKPHQLGATNLEKAFKPLLPQRTQNNSRNNARQLAGKGPSEALTTWFLKLHAHYSQGVAFSAREELEKEVLHRLEGSFKTENNEQLALRLLIANIASCDLAFENIKDAKDWTIERSQSCQYLLLFQVRVAVVLFRVFRPILEDERNADIDEDLEARKNPYGNPGLSPSVKRLLPLIRIYVAWVYVARESLNLYQDWLEPYIRDLYSLLADILSLLLPYAISNPTTVDSQYLLPEDIEARGLKPFADRKLPLFLDVQIVPEYDPPKCRKTIKPRKEILHVDCRPQDEDIWRIRDILCCGIYLAGSAKSPLTIMTTTENVDTWVYLKDGPPKSFDEISMTRMFAQVKMASHNRFLAITDERVRRNDPEDVASHQPLPPQQTSMQPPVQHRQVQSAAHQIMAARSGRAGYAKSNSSLDDDISLSTEAKLAGMVDKLLDEDDDDDPYGFSSHPHGNTSYGMNSSAANEVFGNLMPSPTSRAPQSAAAANGRQIPNLPWNYFFNPTPATESGVPQPARNGVDVPRSIAAQTAAASMGTGQRSPSLANYNNYPNSSAFAYQAYGAQQGYRTEQASIGSIPARVPSAAPALDSPTYSEDQRASALDNLRSALFAQFGSGTANHLQSPTFAYGQPFYSDRNDSAQSKEGHRARTSISSPLANLAKPVSGDRMSQGFMDLQLGEAQGSAAFGVRDDTQLRDQSPKNGPYGLTRPESQVSSYNNSSARSPAFVGSTFPQQFTAISGNETSLEFPSSSNIWAGTPAGARAPRNTVACNGNYFDGTTAFGRNGNVNNRNDPTHFRNRLEELGAGVGESVTAYDRAVLEAAMDDADRKRSQQR
ncbi:hypothetical protein PFICI_07477 [Pestalotiopsis fici W106-1]|uniref:Nonsense-mediated mRNA decay factor n=1 Tax=Pestalotiopsis fici (strain W106-1 / CGMCC3.15140) TaxID=1229662 RepID=W3X1E5_PESFW|nr:uncharacterized protein PFICI_07477 [Pestalotiopsis fici W106-1]ETS79948.1 hypothetical protein PFICI_07477 [Pestalotiopsis fici W106-1]